jgi:hypothetical protein
MVGRSLRAKRMVFILAILSVIGTVPFSVAETVAAAPLGTIATTGNVTVGKSSAPTGTTIFAGDKVASTQPAMITFSGGSRLEMTKAAATFSRQGKTLVVQADQGLLRFNFVKGEAVQINAGKFQFKGINESDHIGELGLNNKGEVVMTLKTGSFAAVNTETGVRTEVTPSKPLVVAKQGGGAAAAGTNHLMTAGAIAGLGGLGVLTEEAIRNSVKSQSSR